MYVGTNAAAPPPYPFSRVLTIERSIWLIFNGAFVTIMTTNIQNLVFFHPDLGIGGAERLVIDAAVGLQDRGHRITIFTSHRDTKHCFDEARDGE